jgi:lysophospholipase
MSAQTDPEPALDRRAIPAGAQESMWLASDGHAIRRFDWPAPGDGLGAGPRGSLLFLPGRGDFFEKWLEALGHWHDRGWAVTAVDWRGQALSGRLGDDSSTGHIEDYRAWTGDLAAFWRQWTANAPGPHVIVAHSMGGHIALRALADGVIDPDAAVLTAPMLGLLPGWLARPVMHLFAKAMVLLRGARTSAWQGGERPDKARVDRFALLTHDRERYADEQWWRDQRPGLELGAPSWGWIERSLASMAAMFRPGALEAVRVPLLLLATRTDGLVSWPAIRKAAARLPNARLIDYGEAARHEILREADPVRIAALAEIDQFFDSPDVAPKRVA